MKRLIILSLLLVSCGQPPKGDKGDTGSQGIPGTTGTQGIPGTPGTVTRIIPLCTKQTVYPLVYSEIAFCIENKLYGVYSLNNGFMVEIVPGTYSSNGLNSSCVFTVKPNCEVVR